MDAVRLLIPVALFVLLLAPVNPAEVRAEPKWITHTDQEYRIAFLSLGAPERRRIDGPDAVKVVWHFGYLDDGTNGSVDATTLKAGGFAELDVVRDAGELRAGMEQRGKTTVRGQRQVTLAGRPAIEFQTTTLTSKGRAWHGVARPVVIGNTLFTITVAAPTEQRLQTAPIQNYLRSFKVLP